MEKIRGIFARLCILLMLFGTLTAGANPAVPLSQFLSSTQFPSGFRAESCENLLLTDAVEALPSPADFRRLSLKQKILLLHKVSYRNFSELEKAVEARDPVSAGLPTWSSLVAQLLRILSEESIKKLQPFNVELWAISLEFAHINVFANKLSERDLYSLILFQKKITALRPPSREEFHGGMLWNVAHSSLVELLIGRMQLADPVKAWREVLLAAQNAMLVAIESGSPHHLSQTASYALHGAVLSYDRVKPAQRSEYVRSVEVFFVAYQNLLEGQLQLDTEDPHLIQAKVLALQSLLDLGNLKHIENFPRMHSSIVEIEALRAQARGRKVN